MSLQTHEMEEILRKVRRLTDMVEELLAMAKASPPAAATQDVKVAEPLVSRISRSKNNSSDGEKKLTGDDIS